MDNPQQGDLNAGLKNRHIQLIALGGAIGTGLFLGISQTIKMAGPLSYSGLCNSRTDCFPDDAPVR